jgi:signal transduction histidine kinase
VSADGHSTRFRRRLAAAFVLVAATAAGFLGVVTYAVAASYRTSAFEDVARRQATVILALAPDDLEPDRFEVLVDAYGEGSGLQTVAVAEDRSLSSSAALDITDVPPDVEVREGRLVTDRTEVDGRPTLLVAGRTDSGVEYYFFNSLQQLEASLTELRNILIVGWVAVVAVALAVGQLVAVRTLRPVREAADAATALAGGHLDRRLAPGAGDEFGALADAFNEMAGTIEAQVRALARAAERERQFTSDVAHDLRTPLTGMAASAALVEKDLEAVPDKLRRPLEVLVSDVARMRELVLDLLELANISGEQHTDSAEVIQVAQAVRAVVSSLHLDPEAVTIDVEPGAQVCIERGAFRRVLANLLTNALRHGGGRATVQARTADGELVLQVLDEGPGIPPEQLPKVFDRFYKTDASRAQGGSGLGLAIVQEHVRAQGGSVTAGNRPGGGACFTVRLPVPDPDADADGTGLDAAEQGSPSVTP